MSQGPNPKSKPSPTSFLVLVRGWNVDVEGESHLVGETVIRTQNILEGMKYLKHTYKDRFLLDQGQLSNGDPFNCEHRFEFYRYSDRRLHISAYYKSELLYHETVLANLEPTV